MFARIKYFGVAVSILALLIAGCAGAGEKSGTYVDDSAITTKVKARLIEDPRTKGLSIQVETYQGTVQLSGFTKSSEEKSAATEVARATSGVKGVKNDMIVRN